MIHAIDLAVVVLSLALEIVALAAKVSATSASHTHFLCLALSREMNCIKLQHLYQTMYSSG